MAAQFENYKYFSYYATPEEQRRGIVTAGFGATFHLDGTPIRIGEVMRLGEASVLLHKRLSDVSMQVWALSGRHISNSQLAALTLFADNVGVGAYQKSTLRQYILRSQYDKASAELLKWNKQAGVELRGLTKRRLFEQRIFNSPPMRCT